MKHIILEDNEVWRATLRQWLEQLELHSEIVETTYSPEKRWYDYTPESVDLLICDGPNRSMGADRTYPLRQEWCNGAGALLDDTKSVSDTVGQWIPMELGERKACAGRVNNMINNEKQLIGA